jgi:flagellin
LLLNIKGLVVQSANAGALSQEELNANQLQVDSAVASITRISSTTNFSGRKLLDGSLDYVTSGVDATKIKTLSIHQAAFGTATTLPVNVVVTTSARTGQLQFAASSVVSAISLEIKGNDGTTVLGFGAGTKASAIAFAVNQVSDSTGVTASLITAGTPTSGINFNSVEYGSRSYVSVQSMTGAFALKDRAATTTTHTAGTDAVATINGTNAVADGRNLSLNAGGLDLDFTLDRSVGTGSTSFDITGGGALFQLGAQVNSNQQVNVAIGSVAASRLGDNEIGLLTDIVRGGAASLISGNSATASLIIDKAIQQVALLRGRLGSFEKNTLNTNVNSLNVALENVTASESSIRDADFAAETSNLTRAQILTQAGTSVLATANSTPQSVLTLLQR